MEFLNLNFDAIQHICKYLDPVNLAMLSSACSGLRYLYPVIEAKHRRRFRKALIDINAIEYTSDHNGDTNRSRRTRIDKIVVSYTRDIYERVLWVDYVYESLYREQNSNNIDNYYSDVARVRIFRNNKDKEMWYRRGTHPYHICRRRFPGSFEIYVTIEEGGRQSINIYDEDLDSFAVATKHYPIWADDKTDN